ncbi:TauD/TfdA family dioxygenase [Myxococcota bacterium]|nr:TauD/TfdA family dioxygenase [Myxococcota bacterium]
MPHEPLEPFGVELQGIDLGAGLSEAEFAALEAALFEHGLVVLRNQPVDLERQVALGRRFGELEGRDFTGTSAHPDVIPVSNLDADGNVQPLDTPTMQTFLINEGWHSDSSFREKPASVSLLASEVVPPVGGDTFFACLRGAWQSLPEDEQRALLGMRAIHDYANAYRNLGDKVSNAKVPELPGVTHPLVRLHSETGEFGLFLSSHTSGVEGLNDDEGRALLARLLAWCTREENVYRHRWSVGDLLLWDNRCTLHRAEGFDGQHARVLHHVRVAGGAPLPATAAGATS